MPVSLRFGTDYGTVLHDDNRATAVCNRRMDGKVYPLVTRTVPDELEITRQMNERLGAIQQNNTQMLAAIQQGFTQLSHAISQRFPTV